MTREAANTSPRLASTRLGVPTRSGQGWYSRSVADAFTNEGRFPPGSKAARDSYVELRCPQCNSSDLKKVSLAYQEGLSRVKTRSRLLGFVFGEGGPDLMVGRATTRGVQQTELSRTLKPPAKWSYLRLIFRSIIFTFVALGAYIVFVASSTPPVSTLPLKLYVFLAPVVFLVIAFAAWRHNHLVYPLEYAEWDRSFLCQRCGAPSLHDIPHNSLREP